MDFKTSIQTCLNKYVTFTGRATRSEYWWWFLAYMIVYAVLSLFSGISSQLGGLLTGLFALAAFLPTLSVGVRRLHDTDKSGWFFLIALVPILGGLALIYLFCQESTAGDNRFGPNPLILAPIQPPPSALP